MKIGVRYWKENGQYVDDLFVDVGSVLPRSGDLLAWEDEEGRTYAAFVKIVMIFSATSTRTAWYYVLVEGVKELGAEGLKEEEEVRKFGA